MDMMDRIMKLLTWYQPHLAVAAGNPAFPQYGQQYGEMHHAFGTAYLASTLAYRRNLSTEIAFATGLLHDAGRVVGGVTEDHPRKAGFLLRPVLEESGYSLEEVDIILEAVTSHAYKSLKGSPYSEVLKDAILLERAFSTGTDYADMKKSRQRLKHGFKELGFRLK
jgi:HD superfamily phosphodiesterase